MTLVRAGEDRDLPDIVAMGRARAERYRFHLDRDRDFVHFAIVRKRLLAGLGPAGEREVQFFVAEEGGSAVAYVVDHRPTRCVGARGVRRSRSVRRARRRDSAGPDCEGSPSRASGDERVAPG